MAEGRKGDEGSAATKRKQEENLEGNAEHVSSTRDNSSGSLKQKRTLVIPAVAIGNVGQIAVNVLCRLVKQPVEVVDSRGLLMPCAGNVGKGPNRRLSTALELHTLNNDIAFLHINSMVVPGKSREFAKYITKFAQERGFERILVVGGASALALINDDQLSRTRHLPRIYRAESEKEGFVPLEYQISELKLAGLLPFLVQEAEGHLELTAIISFVFEGENWSDGVEMARHTMNLLDIALDNT